MEVHQQLLQLAAATPWAMHSGRHAEMMATLQAVASGSLSLKDLRKSAEAAHKLQAARVQAVASASGGAVAVIPVYGTIIQRSSLLWYYLGGASTEDIGAQIRAAAADPKVRAIVLDVDSGGGTVSGVEELFSLICSLRGKKDVVAISDSMMASAAYYLSAGAKAIWATPSSLTGSIGVYTTHVDYSAYMAEAGIKVTFIQYGENKTNGNPYEPLSEDAQAEMQAMVNAFGQAFDAACAKGRDVSKADVKAKFGQGKVFTATGAKSAGLIDNVGTLDDLLAKYGVSRFPAGGTAMSMESPTEAPEAEGVTEEPVAEDDAAKRVRLDAEHAHRARQLELATI